MSVRKCPYCGKKMSYLSALMEKSRGEHNCNACHRNSTIYYTKGFKVSIIVTIIAAVAILIVCLLPALRGKILDLLLAFVPFLVFYLCTPIFFKLVPLRPRVNNTEKDKKKRKKGNDYSTPIPQPASGSTRIINVVDESTSKQNVDDGKTRIMPQIKD